VSTFAAASRGRRLSPVQFLSRFLAVIAAAALLGGCASTRSVSPEAAARAARERENIRMFDRVDRLVETRHYSPAMLARRHWPELRDTYRPYVAAAGTERSAYALVNEMLHKLHDSHTVAFRPEHEDEGFSRAVAVVAYSGSASSPRMESRVLDDGALYLRFDHFDPKSVSWLQKELATHQAAPGIVLDLRENCGGYVDSSRVAIGEFFDHRVATGIVVHRDGRETIGKSISARASTRYLGPLTVLVGAHSCSSAEVFASVIQHNARGTIIGQTTAGRVLGSEKFPLPDGGHLQLSTTGFLKLDGEPLEGSGVVPDVHVDPGARGVGLADRDPELAAALDVMRSARFH
jgi:C-terminal processing protease CtpA/Prc